MTDVQSDLYVACGNQNGINASNYYQIANSTDGLLGKPNNYFIDIWYDMNRDLGISLPWDYVPCSEIACCISYLGGNATKILPMNYAEGMYNLYLNASRVGSTPQLGAFVWFQYGSNVPEHTGRVVGFDNDYIYTVEGNVGGIVVALMYPRNSPSIYAYGYPYYTGQIVEPFVVRTSSPEGEDLIYYNNSQNNGLNTFPNGNSADGNGVVGANVLNNTYGYSQGRIMEMHDAINPSSPISPTNNPYSIFNTEYHAITNPNAFVNWYHGGLAYNNGYASSNQAYIRTTFIQCRKGSTIDVDSGYKCTICVYTSNTESTYYTGKSATVSGQYTVPIDGYVRIAIARTDNQTQTDFSIKSHLKLVIIKSDSWIRIANDNNYTVLMTPSNGAVGVWSNGAEAHVANVETFADNTWWISESHKNYGGAYGSWDFSYLHSAPEYLPDFLSGDSSWHLLGFISLFSGNPTPVPPTPPSPTPVKSKLWLMLRNPYLYY